MDQVKRVALVGGTGLLGSAVVQVLLARNDQFELTLFTRSISTHKIPAEVRVVAIESFDDISEESSTLVRWLRGHDVLVSTLNSAVALELEPKLVAAAIQAGVKHFMPSEYTLDVTHPAARALGKGNMLGARVSWADKLATIASSGQITYTTLVTGGFLDWGIKSGMLGFDLAQRAAVLYDGGQHKVTACTVSFVAEAILTALRMPNEKTANKRLYVAEVEYTGEELLRTIELASGDKWTATQLSTESAKENGMKLQAEGNLRAAYLNFARALNFDGCGAADLRSGLEFGRELEVDLQRRSLSDIVRSVIDEATTS
ncbi:hypothetical protein LTR99_005019 [Exophiala xenobiotica]|uniref:NmrA-like domain-containing protein n=1 Tax=Vermiconidia calcicola TaxID=1690605 RepID=A0AAV9PS78_9PEZI|nr:hypothetical protein H2202_005576 [Exophiala xenobiotica]KAK5528230.1 hypothetical protein LTR25_010537 [Vermiconidia calcicola]KAK5532161.1 hypothetical protein LTR23_009686 [Chaetothyriales sp. CCFEE 6169]KAK5196230.1 hypothetical protein LTR92_003774 [Exophiala xenobiotica]KAK5214350.1 hypothetical protein LTR41_000543 [Exophiala xenobiotica]